MNDKYNTINDKIKIFEEFCKAKGLKVTYQRLEIFNILANSYDHPSAEDIYKKVKPKIPTISFDTVYRTLALFDSYGLIAKVQYLDDKTRYDPNMKPHHHLVCIKCKKIQDFYWPDIEEMEIPEETKGWGLIKNRYLELRGICQECLDKEKKNQKTKL